MRNFKKPSLLKSRKKKEDFLLILSFKSTCCERWLKPLSIFSFQKKVKRRFRARLKLRYFWFRGFLMSQQKKFSQSEVFEFRVITLEFDYLCCKQNSAILKKWKLRFQQIKLQFESVFWLWIKIKFVAFILISKIINVRVVVMVKWLRLKTKRSWVQTSN